MPTILHPTDFSDNSRHAFDTACSLVKDANDRLLEGQVAFTALGKTQTIQGGELLYLPAAEPHSVKGLQDASLLLTGIMPKG